MSHQHLPLSTCNKGNFVIFRRLLSVACMCVLSLLAIQPASADDSSGVKLCYTFDHVNGKTVTDESGSGYDGTVMNDAKVMSMGKYQVLYLGNGSGYLDMGTKAGNLLTTLTDFTVSAYYRIDADASLTGNGYFLWAFSSLAANTSTDGLYTAYRLNAQRFATSTGGYTNEKGLEKGSAATKNAWQMVVYRQSGAKGELFINGVLVGTNTSMPVLNQVFTTATAYNWIGRSPFSADNYLKGTMVYDFRIYDHAVSDSLITADAAKTKDLDDAYNYGTVGDFAALKALLTKCDALLSSADISAYPTTAVEEFKDVYAFAKRLVDANKGSQNLIDERQTALQTAYDRLLTTKGIAFTSASGTYNTNRGFRHPGALHTQADFDRVKERLAAKDSIITAAYARLCANQYSQSNVTTWPVETIVRGGGVGENYMNAARGAAMAYQNALRWKISGNKANADCAVKVLNAWAKVTKNIGGDSNYALAAGLYGYEFANAAELMRDYDGWAPEDFKAFQDWMLYLWYPCAEGFLRGRNGTWENSANAAKGECPGHYWSNWGLCNDLCMMSIGILCDDPFIYNQGLSFYKYDQVGTFKAIRTAPIINDGLTEFIGNLVPDLQDDARGPFGKLGQMQESGRDQGHALMALGLSVDICQTALNQGDDLYSYMDNRLAAGIEHVAALNFCGVSSADMPWTDYWYHDCRHKGIAVDSWQMTGDNTGGLGGYRPYWDRILGYYEGIQGVKMQYSEKAAAAVGVDGGAGEYGVTSGGFDHLGFSTLMNYRPLVDRSMAPTALSPQMIYNGTTYNHNELGGLKNTYQVLPSNALDKGGRVKLVPVLPTAEQNTGKWSWSTGETTQQIEVGTDESKLYRVTYTNAKGVESSLVFSIAVKGDCRATKLTPSIVTNGTTVNDTVATVLAGMPVTLKAASAMGWGYYQWNNGITGWTTTIEHISSDRTYSVAYTNPGGAQAVLNFRLKVVGMTPSISVDSAAAQPVSEIIALKGQTITLAPVTSTEYTDGEWQWSNGAVSQNLTLKNVQEGGVYTVKHVFGTRTDELTFTVYLSSVDKVPADGNYYIKNNNDGTYFTNTGTILPAFKTKDTVAVNSQVWNIVHDGSRFKITSIKDGRFLSDYARFTGLAYNTDKYTYNFIGIYGTDRYDIQCSENAGSYYWIINSSGTINGKGSSSLTTDYPFVLEAVDLTGIEDGKIESVRFYPNPVEDYLHIAIPQSQISGNATFELTTLNGCFVLKKALDKTDNQLWIKQLPSGVYVGKLCTSSGVKTVKIIKH
jgi:hypothetical protein